jgi:hypothetical protein
MNSIILGLKRSKVQPKLLGSDRVREGTLEASHQHRQQTTVLIYSINLRISVLTTVTRDDNINRSASGTLLSSELELSFWGGVNSQSGEIVYRHHPLSGQHLKGTILAIPCGLGSCSGSGVIT